MSKCAHPSCQRTKTARRTTQFCVFHAPVADKGISFEAFANLIDEQFNKGDYNFEGYVFPSLADFHEKTFDGDVNFRKAQFLGGGVFKELSREGLPPESPKSGCADFRKVVFKGSSDFTEAAFSGELADFSEAQFIGKACLFDHTCFKTRRADFVKTVFAGEYAGFWHTDFWQTATSFIDATFENEEADFSHSAFGSVSFFMTHFRSLIVTFEKTRFDHVAKFAGVDVRCNLDFVDLQLSEHTRFEFQYVRVGNEGGLVPLILFKGIEFRAFCTFFEMLPAREEGRFLPPPPFPIFLFRFCQLKDVFFSENQLEFFSFYKSSFDEAHFVSSRWGEISDRVLGIPFKRKCMIGDELLLRYSLVTPYDEPQWERLAAVGVDQFRDYNEIAVLYRRFKTTLDNAKDYQRAGWLYFNEFEMKRLAIREEMSRSPWYQELTERGRYLLYSLYRLVAGYGEKPLWSFVWICTATPMFAAIHLLSGLSVGTSSVMNYDISFKGVSNLLDTGFLGRFLSDYGIALVFTIYRLIPVGYLPSGGLQIAPVGADGLLWSFLNSVVLILLATLTGIGLKRHFRRF